MSLTTNETEIEGTALEFDPNERIYSPTEAQRRFCQRHAYPWVAPISRCSKCQE